MDEFAHRRISAPAQSSLNPSSSHQLLPCKGAERCSRAAANTHRHALLSPGRASAFQSAEPLASPRLNSERGCLWVGLSQMCLPLPPVCLHTSSGLEIACCAHRINTGARLHRLGFPLTLCLRWALLLPVRDLELCWDCVQDDIHPPE